MKKIVIFNVGGALSAYGEFDDKKFIVDLGNRGDFSPVDNFLVPLNNRGHFVQSMEVFSNGKMHLDQLFLSHLDQDHIADYEKFRKIFHASFMTCPNDNSHQRNEFKVNREKLGTQSDMKSLVLDDMKNRGTTDNRAVYMSIDNPLVSVIDEISLFYIKPQTCEGNSDLSTGYPNNLSLVLFLKVDDKTVLLPGDILKNGMKFLIDNCIEFKTLLEKDGIDYLVAPHHGLETSFPIELFNTIKGNKTRLNIISEKVRNGDSNENRRPVDTRYYSEVYSTGENSLNQRAVKTSGGHIVIDFDTPENEIKKYPDIDDVINEFCN